MSKISTRSQKIKVLKDDLRSKSWNDVYRLQVERLSKLERDNSALRIKCLIFKAALQDIAEVTNEGNVYRLILKTLKEAQP